MDHQSDEKIKKLKESLEKQHGRKFTWEETSEAYWGLKKIVDIAMHIAPIEFKKQELLKEFPKGFHLEEGGSCVICGSHVAKKMSWYDKYGLKCINCQKAINEKIIPVSIIKNSDTWYSRYELATYFNLKGADLNKCIKQSFLQVRTILNEKNKIHFQVFLIKDNKNVLPPKKLLESRMVKIILKGEPNYTQQQWYEFADEKLIKKLAKYRIIEVLAETFKKPVDTSRLLIKKFNPLFTIRNLVDLTPTTQEEQKVPDSSASSSSKLCYPSYWGNNQSSF